MIYVINAYTQNIKIKTLKLYKNNMTSKLLIIIKKQA